MDENGWISNPVGCLKLEDEYPIIKLSILPCNVKFRRFQDKLGPALISSILLKSDKFILKMVIKVKLPH